MYERFYGLTDDPFRLLPDPGVCFPHKSCAKVWAYLRYAVRRGEGILVITGAPGTGKTTLGERLMEELERSRTLGVRLVAGGLNADALLFRLASALGIASDSPDPATLAYRVECRLNELDRKEGRRVALLIDEAQTLSPQTLEALRVLTDLQSPRSRPLLQLFLLGQEELEQVLQEPLLEPFRQRIIASCRLCTMDLEETRAYLEYRLQRAGWRGDPAIDGRAVHAIHRLSRGLPRHVNRIASRLLLHGSAEAKHELGEADVLEVVRDLRDELLPTSADETDLQPATSPAPCATFDELALRPPADEPPETPPARPADALRLPDPSPTPPPSATDTERPRRAAYSGHRHARPRHLARRLKKRTTTWLKRGAREITSRTARWWSLVRTAAKRFKEWLIRRTRLARQRLHGWREQAKQRTKSAGSGPGSLTGQRAFATAMVLLAGVLIGGAVYWQPAGHPGKPAAPTIAPLPSSSAQLTETGSAPGPDAPTPQINSPTNTAEATAPVILQEAPVTAAPVSALPVLPTGQESEAPPLPTEPAAAVPVALTENAGNDALDPTELLPPTAAGGALPSPTTHPLPQLASRHATATAEAPSAAASTTTPAPDAESSEKAPNANEQRIARLLQQADHAIAENRLLIPEGRSAFGYLKQALALAPDNPKARQGMQRIVRRYLEKARKALAKNDYARARLFVHRALRVEPKDHSALAMRRQVDAAEAKASALAANQAIADRTSPNEPPPRPARTPPPAPPADSGQTSYERVMSLLDDI